MFQTFSGSSRRPRQVNLSGQNVNPFAASGFGPSGSGTQQTVAHAQQERQQRQRERERLNASKKIQRVWRGHKVRRELAESQRLSWDSIQTERVADRSVSVEQIRLLVAFSSSRRRDDLERLSSLSTRLSNLGFETVLAREDVQPLLPQLAHVTVGALQTSLPQCPSTLLQLLVSIVNQQQNLFPHISRSYYTYLSALLTDGQASQIDPSLFLTAVRIPLVEHSEQGRTSNVSIQAYEAFALYFLTTPNIANQGGLLDGLASVVDVSLVSSALLSSALARDAASNVVDHIGADRKLWLLAHFISLNRLQQRSSQEPEYLRALSLQLSSSSGDILSRIDVQDPEVLREITEREDGDTIPPIPLPTFVKDELLSLVNQSSITGLLAKFNIDYAKASTAGEEDASLLASYALTLLRIFPRRGDEIRMWLYLGSMTEPRGRQIPALKFFWQAMSLTNTFSVVTADSKAALTLLRPQTQYSSAVASNDLFRDREWRTILLFLELYTFVLRFTDDEEFLSGNNLNLGQMDAPNSRIRKSALPIEDVKHLTIFLKNLAFTTYYNAAELSGDVQPAGESGIGSYFATSVVNSSRFESESSTIAKAVSNRPFAGIAGMTFEYVRTIVTGVMRMLYERDSRRRFLPKDHWLMTSRFDMEGFIPAVVAEEERQHQIGEEGEDEDTGNDPLFDMRGSGLVGMARDRRARQIENLRRQQQKAARQKVLAAVGPRLEVLQHMPFVIPFETRVQIFREFVYRDQFRRRGGNVDPDIWRMSIIQAHGAPRTQGPHRPNRTPGEEQLGPHHAKIRRDQVFEDAYEQFFELGEGLKEPIQITFVDQFDTVEAGIDGGGVTKEFLTSVTNEAFRAEDGPNLFITNDQNLLYPNPAALDERQELLKQAGLRESSTEWRENIHELLRHYEFLGRIVGKCLYEGILVDIGFAGFFLLKWAAAGATGAESGYRPNINDLRDLDEGLYQGLLKLKNYSGNVEDFSLDFTITDTISLPGAPTQTIERDLMPNGSKTAVTNENRLLYVSCVARHRLQKQPYRQTQAFLKGLSEIINPSWLSMFNQSELQTLIGGDSSEIDVADLRRNTLYGGVYVIGDDGQEHPTVKLFWKVMKALDDSDRRKVLKYVTSTPRAPLLGFSQLNPRFSIRDAGSDETRLPSTSTCVNLLKLPRYSTEDILRQKLLYAVNSGAGFDLS
ncbi:uncharacterized protein LY89DRAFT_638276 [Mollisia scopiformis]|uniref:HECT-type E3 ubiquitin transferase n=1 Tax=Mollisia scopiformis TaxID=149040 RepID=A0A194XQT3_MOLSC|nr:uncharacterized protein LY89DRAFT_638276 [Mollisia scopiformis]KUJ22087.1 hypothetical protein LY89DRAFT_638276 [Mollisia scopiformis]